jgi:PKD repeat protein
MAIIADFSITASSRVGDNSNMVIFNDASTGTVTNYKWIFGDGQVIEGAFPTVTHTYTLPGKYTVTLVANNLTEQGSIVKEDYIIVNDVKPVPKFIIMEAFDNVAGYWRFYVDLDFHIVFETPQYLYRSADRVLNVHEWSLVQFDYSSEKMFFGTYLKYFREIATTKVVNLSPLTMTEAKTEIAYQSELKLDELKVWSSEKDLSNYYKETRGRAGYLDLK